MPVKTKPSKSPKQSPEVGKKVSSEVGRLIPRTLYSLYNQTLPKDIRLKFRDALKKETSRHETTIYDWINEETRPSPAEQKIVVAQLNKFLPKGEPKATVDEIFN